MRKKSLFAVMCLTLLVFTLLFAARPSQADAIRIGILGDSNSDEYRADDNRGGSYAATTLNWVELLQRYRGADFGLWGTYGGERRSGYAFNWARSGATSASMTANGQHTGLAAQIAGGQVDYAIIYVGTNDFHFWNNTYQPVYDGTLVEGALIAKIDSIVNNITTAVDTLRSAGAEGVVLVNFSDPGAFPEFMRQFPDAAKRGRVTSAINQINTRLADLAVSRNITLADVAAYTAYLMSLIDTNGNLMVGDQAISLLVKGNEPHHLQLGDSVGHAGTIASGIFANFIMDVLADHYGVAVAPFSDSEMLVIAGIGPAPTATPTSTDSPTFTLEPTFTLTSTATATPTLIFTPTYTLTPTQTFAPTLTFTPVPSLTPSSASPSGGNIVKLIAASSDDVNEVNNALTSNAKTIWLGTNGSTNASYTGLRFTGLQIPRGAIIQSAVLSVYSAQLQWTEMRLSIHAHAVGNSPAFSSSNRPSQRQLTAATVNTTNNALWLGNTWYNLPDLKTIVAQIVQRSDWQSGNSISFVVKGTSGTRNSKVIRSFDGAASFAPRLTITYTMP